MIKEYLRANIGKVVPLLDKKTQEVVKVLVLREPSGIFRLAVPREYAERHQIYAIRTQLVPTDITVQHDLPPSYWYYVAPNAVNDRWDVVDCLLGADYD